MIYFAIMVAAYIMMLLAANEAIDFLSKVFPEVGTLAHTIASVIYVMFAIMVLISINRFLHAAMSKEYDNDDMQDSEGYSFERGKNKGLALYNKMAEGSIEKTPQE